MASKDIDSQHLILCFFLAVTQYSRLSEIWVGFLSVYTCVGRYHFVRDV